MKTWHRIDDPNMYGWRAQHGARQVEVVRVETGRYTVSPMRDGRRVVTGKRGPHWPTARQARMAGLYYLNTGVFDGMNADELPLAKVRE